MAVLVVVVVVGVGLHIIAGLSLLSNPYYVSTFSRELHLLSNPHNLSTYCVQDTVEVHAMGFRGADYLL